MKLSVILSLLEGVKEVERDSRWQANCPAHKDSTPSLSISAGKKQETALHCFAGCDYEDILKSLRAQLAKQATDYYYHDAKGNVIGRIRRVYDENGNKKFYQQIPNGEGWKNGSSQRLKNTPYRLPEVLDAIKNKRPIFIVEGEKDADRLCEEGRTATCNAQGAGKWNDAHAEYLKDARRVFIIADNDAPGLKHAWNVYDSLEVTKVTVHTSPFGKDITEHLNAGHTLKELVEQEQPAIIHPRIITGSSFIFDTPAEVPAVWGNDGKIVLWAKGQGCMIVAPQGVGKTTLASLLLEGRLGLTDKVLDMSVTPSEKNQLYMALDRPDQIANAMRRRFEQYGRSNAELMNRLKVWPGPPEQDYGRHPEALVELAASLDADTIFIDSLKDAVLGLSKEETGQGWNNAVQLCLLEGIQVCILNHPVKVKSQEIKPTTLDDVYGSQWITAGLGSVLSLYGDRNSSFAELSHLKQPSTPIDTLVILRNGKKGTMEAIGNQLDWAYFFMLPRTVKELTEEMFKGEVSPANTAKARRQVEELKARGIIVEHSTTLGEKGKPAQRYTLREPE